MCKRIDRNTLRPCRAQGGNQLTDEFRRNGAEVQAKDLHPNWSAAKALNLRLERGDPADELRARRPASRVMRPPRAKPA